METWQLLAGLAAMLVLYAVLTTATGYDATAFEVVTAFVMGAVGLYIGAVASERLFSDRE